MKYCFVTLLVLVGCNSESQQPNSSKESQNLQNEEIPWFQEVAQDVGVSFNYHSGQTGDFYIIETMGGGVALFDFDNDGDLDLYVTQGNNLGSAINPELTNKLYENDGTGKFKDVTSFSGSGDPRYSIGVATGDYNNDGYVDLYVTNYGRNTLLKNNQDGTFQDVTSFAGVGNESFSVCAAFVDIDNDQDLDLFVTNYLDWSTEKEIECYSELNRRDYCNPASYDSPISDTLFVNNGDGTFTDISVKSGIASKKGTGLGIGIGDVNKDGLQDIFVANDGMQDQLWINRGGNVFIDEALLYGCSVDNTGKMKGSMGVELADIDNDQDLDLYVTTLFRETDSFFINREGTMLDSTARWGLAADTRTFTGWAIIASDFNNDGEEDLYETTGRVRWQADQYDENDWLAEPNLLFMQKNNRFTLVEPIGGTEQPLIYSAHGAAVGDLNLDGLIDIVVVNKDASLNVLQNVLELEDTGNWIKFDIRNQFGSPALGAKVEISLVDGRKIYKQVRSSSGYASSHDPVIHVGLGTSTQIRGVKVTWQNGISKSFGPLDANLMHRIKP